MADFHRLPGDSPQIDTNLGPGELITAVSLPPRDSANYTYLKIRDRPSYAFALVSVAAALGSTAATITEARIALGGVAHKPWRDPEAEADARGSADQGQDLRERPTPCCATPEGSGTTSSRSSWPAGRSSGP